MTSLLHMMTMPCARERSSDNILKLSIYDSINLLHKEHWESLLKNSNIYLSLEYLQSIEQALMDSIDFRYILFYDSEFNPVGAAVVQLHRFSAGEIDIDALEERLNHPLPSRIMEKMEIRLMICGNAFSTGENGFFFCDSVDGETAMQNLVRALDRIQKEENKSKDRVSLFIAKDFWPESREKVSAFIEDGYREISLDVHMVLRFKTEWKSWDDYLAAMTTKYRTKVKGIFKKSASISSKILSNEEVIIHSDRIDALYKQVIDKAGYRFGTLSPEVFANFRKNLSENFFFRGYFLQDELVGFSTSFLNHDILDANFVGIDYSINVDMALYQRMLCDLVKSGLEHDCSEVRLGRTAEQVKSCLGAEPVDMKLLMRHRNSITNTLIKPLVDSIKPSSFELRKPFKAAVYETWTQ